MYTWEPDETMQEAFCDELECGGPRRVLARRYDTGHRARLTQAAKGIHDWLVSLDEGHLDAASHLTCAEIANAFARAAGDLKTFPESETEFLAALIRAYSCINDLVEKVPLHEWTDNPFGPTGVLRQCVDAIRKARCP
jgi:hypothetical protein